MAETTRLAAAFDSSLEPGWMLGSAMEVSKPEAVANSGLTVLEETKPMIQGDAGGLWRVESDSAGEGTAAQWIVDRSGIIAIAGIAPGSSGSPRVGQFAISSYTVQPGGAGFHQIKDSKILRVGGSPGRVELRVFVTRLGIPADQQPEPTVYTFLNEKESFDFDVFLGYLDEGDTVNVGIGPAGDPAGDRVEIDFRIERTAAISVSSFPEDLSGTGLAAPAAWTVTGDAGEVPRGADSPAPAESLASLPLKVGAGSSLATVAFRVPQSGYYALHEAQASAGRDGGGAVEARVFAGEESSPRRRVAVPANGGGSVRLNADIGYVQRGEVIRIDFALTGSTEEEQIVNVKGTVVEWAPRRAPLRVKRGADGLLDVIEPGAPRTAVDIPAEKWVTVPASKEDATNAIRDAIRKAASLRTGREFAGVRFERGARYIVGTKQEGGSLFSFDALKRLILDGNGCTLVVDSPELARKGVDLFHVSGGSYSLAFADFTVESTSLPFAIGNILDVSPKRANTQTVTFQVESGSADPLKDIARNGNTGGFAYDPNIPGRLAEGTWSHYPPDGDNSLKATDRPGVFTHRVTRTGASISEGKWMIKNKQAGIVYLVAGEGTRDITLSGIEGRAAGGGQLRFWQASGVNILDSRFEPEGTNWISSSSDGVHGRGREGVWIENTVIRGICEDIMNTYASTMAVAPDENPADKEVMLRIYQRREEQDRGGSLLPTNESHAAIGDRLVFFNPKSGRILGQARVLSIGADGRYTLSDAIPDIDTWEPGDGKSATMVYNREAAARFFVRDSRMTDSMRYGIYLKAEGGVIFHNVFDGLPSPAIFAANEPEWPEGPPPTNLWVEGNIFSQGNYGYMSRHREFLDVDPAAISVYTRRLRGAQDAGDHTARIAHAEYANSHVKIVGNTFHDWRGMGIAVRNARNVLIADNLFLPAVDDPVMRQTLARDPLLRGDGGGEYAAIFLDSVNGVRLMGNSFLGLAKNDRQMVFGADVENVVQSGNMAGPLACGGERVRLPFSERFGIVSRNMADGAGPEKATLHGVRRTTGWLGAGLTFDGRSSAGLPASGSGPLEMMAGLTVGLWVEPALGPQGRQVIYNQVQAGNGVIVAIDRGRFVAGLWTESQGVWLDLGPAVTSVWQHIAFAYDGLAGTIKGYRNGKELASAATGVPAQMEIGGAGAVFGEAVEGARVTSETILAAGSAPYAGGLDEYCEFGRAITPLEISALAMRHPRATQGTPLVVPDDLKGATTQKGANRQ